MKQIITFFQGIIQIFISIWNFLSNTFKILADILVFAYNIVIYAISVIGSLPTWLQAFATLSISISVIFLILGRQGSENK